MNEKKRKIILIVLGIVILILVLVLILRGCSTKEYTVTFNTDGGSNVASLKVDKDDKIIKPSDPTKEGYVFEGWYYNGKLFDFNTKITGDIVLEAKWSIEGKVTGVSLDVNEITLKPNGTHNLVVTILPDSALNKNVTWTSSDDNIVEVSKDGKIKALKKGSATITVTTEDGNYSAECKVTVTDDIINVTGVSISGQSTVKVGKTIKLTVVIKPEDASDKSVTWTSSDNTIATVDNNGTVKGIKSGKVTITVTTNEGKNIATKEVTVEEGKQTPSEPTKPSEQTKPTEPEPPKEENKEVKVTGIEITGGKDIYVGDTLNLTYEITPSNATNKKVTWKSSNDGIATVKDGVVKGIKSGEVTITVTTEDGQKTDSIKITIKEKEDTYVVYLKEEKQSGTGNVMQYSFRITKNGNNFTDYKGFVYNGMTHLKGKGLIDIDDLGDKGTKTATIYLDENTTVKASVVYES